MALMNVKNWQQLKSKATGKVHKSAQDVVRARVKLVLALAVKVSPQWSGNFAMNWTVATNYLGPGSYDRGMKVDPWQNLKWWDTGTDKVTDVQKAHNAKYDGAWASYAGAPKAIAKSKVREYEAIDTIKWNTKVSIVNHAPVADIMDSVNLRNVNLIAGKAGVIAYLKAKYPNIVV
jgi:hypothetical protein